MQGRLVVGLWSGAHGGARRHGMRLMVTKASSRAAVHGSKLPVTETLNVAFLIPWSCALISNLYIKLTNLLSSFLQKEEVEMEINKGKQRKENKRKEVEKSVDSQIKRSDDTYTPVERRLNIMVINKLEFYANP
jgi:hypothetical protein